MQTPKHVFFDLDSTLTPSRAQMLPEHQPLFRKLCEMRDVIVVTGGAEEQIHKQLPLPPRGLYYMLSQQGNLAIDKSGEVLWHERVTPEQEAAARAVAPVLIDAFQKLRPTPIPNADDLFENRGSLLAVSVVGFHAPNEVKYAADPDQSIRRKVLEEHAAEAARLRAVGLDIMPAGTTTFDIILMGRHKGSNITRLNERMDWKKEDCLYIGDALFKGGNDESVIGVIPTHAVKDHNETFSYIQNNLL
jgi:phosphomannomutase